MDEFEAIFGASSTPAQQRAPEQEQADGVPQVEGDGQGNDQGGDEAAQAPATEGAQGQAPKPREDWRVRAAREEERRLAAEARVAELQAAAAEAAKPKAEPKEEPKPLPRPDPITDPDGFAAYIDHQTTKRILDGFEEDLREAKGSAEVDAKIALFEQAVKANPALGPEVMKAKNPWRAMFREAEKFAKRQEIGDDPEAFRTKVEAEIRAKVEAEMKAAGGGEQQEAPGGVADDRSARKPADLSKIPQSLAGARNAAGRSSGGFSGPVPLESLLPA